MNAEQLAIKKLQSLYESKETFDAHFVFKQNCKMVKISAHKIVLANESLVFKAMFYGPMKEIGSVKIDDISPTAFEFFLQVVYFKTDMITMDNITDVMCIADKYDASNVMMLCAQVLDKHHMIGDHLCKIFELAMRYGLDDLQISAERKIFIKFLDVSENFDIDSTTLKYIMRSKCLTRNEKEIFDACIRWAKKSCEKKSIDPIPQNLRSELGECFELIDFDRMTLKEFIQCGSSCSFFTIDEYKSIIEKLDSKSIAVPSIKPFNKRINRDIDGQFRPYWALASKRIRNSNRASQ
ncbi:BTB/POZ domain-containing protein 6-like [Contarinia nasturtii]|uniref:BTB/POZ domain-containing protein 6-like n=1 Tax=Contarinia nasturtii TaxID=265458 RepID=UPI0012D4B081|nr:BTB/POZ domain-containing protein 6-like [Contarinia nasturtii]